MATLVLSAAGAAIGGAVGGTVLGLSSAVIGKAIGATIGTAIDQRLMGTGSSTVSVGRLDALRIQGASEGVTVPRVFGRVRVAGNVIWASRFLETKKQSGGTKGNPRKVVSYSYSVSLALALCEGEVTRIGRVWADGNEISMSTLNWRLVPGTEDQMPDPLIEAIEGAPNAPAYRGTAYLVLEDLDLGPFGNRVPQFNIEVVRKVHEQQPVAPVDPYGAIKGIALVPGSGEYALATTPVRFDLGKGQSRSANVNTAAGVSDIEASMVQLDQELGQVESVSLVVSWFGDDLRCGNCAIRPCVEQSQSDPAAMPWQVNSVPRASASVVSQIDGRPAFGGTPTDASVVEAIQLIKGDGREVMFYPFILMDIPAGNGLPDPWTGAVGQPVFPWRGRITLDTAPGIAGTVDKTTAASSQVDSFFGTAGPNDFLVSGNSVTYTGPQEWSYRRFILHYAHLCVAAGGVDTFIIGSEMRGLTSIRSSSSAFPAVAHLQTLAADVRSVLGASTKISYAADWSEYFGYHPDDGSGDVLFHLDDLWSDPNIDFVGIDHYAPLSDWRDDGSHLDQSFGSIHNLDYLTGNVAGGEGYDWYYINDADRDLQIRTPIADGAYGEAWVFRYKDLKSWWSNPHHNRLGGVRDTVATSWQAQSKPIWFTEFGCSAIDKGTNQPNIFYDPKSSESKLPHYSNRNRDDFIQYRYLQAHYEHWADIANNPVSTTYPGSMVDVSRMHVWAWDARPWPDFPNRIDVWSDGENYGYGHWISGRTGLAPLSAVVGELAERANFTNYDVKQLQGAVQGYLVTDVESPRQSMQPLMLSFGFDGFESAGTCAFKTRVGLADNVIPENVLATNSDEPPASFTRDAMSSSTSSVQISYYNASNDYQIGTASVGFSEATEPTVTSTELPVVLSASESLRTADRWLVESEVARDTVTFTLPPSQLQLTVGDVVDLAPEQENGLYRIDKIEEAMGRLCSGTRIEPGIYQNGRRDEDPLVPRSFALPAPVYVEFLDLPLIWQDDLPHAPRVAAAGVPWLGPVSVYSSTTDSGYSLNSEIATSATVGTLKTDMPARAAGLWANGAGVDVELASGELISQGAEEVLNGANLAAIRNQGANDWEIIQFRDAQLVAPMTYRLDGFLRGQFGTDAIMPAIYTIGADFVLLDGAAAQLNLTSAERGLARHFRIGPSVRGYNDDSYVHQVATFEGVGLRPYSVSHPRATRLETGDVVLNWVRRTRIDGDSWAGQDVPLGEDNEAYVLRIVQAGTILREVTTANNSWTYASAEQITDGVNTPFEIDIAQISVQAGPGPFTRITFDG